MSCYENLVMKTQMNYSRHYSTYASGGTAVVLSKQKPLPYEEQIQEFVRRVQDLNTTQNAPIREPYLDLDRILQGKDFHILTTNQDTQFVKDLSGRKKRSVRFRGDHRFFQCSQCCQDETWDAVQPVADMIAAMGEGTMVPDELIPRCPHCGAEMFPWVRGYGIFCKEKIRRRI